MTPERPPRSNVPETSGKYWKLRTHADPWVFSGCEDEGVRKGTAV